MITALERAWRPVDSKLRPSRQVNWQELHDDHSVKWQSPEGINKQKNIGTAWAVTLSRSLIWLIWSWFRLIRSTIYQVLFYHHPCYLLKHLVEVNYYDYALNDKLITQTAPQDYQEFTYIEQHKLTPSPAVKATSVNEADLRRGTIWFGKYFSWQRWVDLFFFLCVCVDKFHTNTCFFECQTQIPFVMLDEVILKGEYHIHSSSHPSDSLPCTSISDCLWIEESHYLSSVYGYSISSFFHVASSTVAKAALNSIKHFMCHMHGLYTASATFTSTVTWAHSTNTHTSLISVKFSWSRAKSLSNGGSSDESSRGLEERDQLRRPLTLLTKG